MLIFGQNAIVSMTPRATVPNLMADEGTEMLAGAAREMLVMVIASLPVLVYVPYKVSGAPAMILSTNAVTLDVSLYVA